MNHLLRAKAPITDAGWELLDEEARERLAPVLAARKLVDFSGPHGWEYSATNLGRVAALAAAPAAEGVSALQRRVLPLVELRADFGISRAELRDGDRGADDVDLAPLDRAAQQMAIAENAVVFHGWSGAITGIVAASPHAPVPLHAMDVDKLPHALASAVDLLVDSGIGGPYGLALAPPFYLAVSQSAERGGHLVFDHLKRIIDGPIVRAPGVEGAVLVSLRGGDFVLECGQDLSIGYDSHDGDVVRLYLEESISFHVATPEAAVALSA